VLEVYLSALITQGPLVITAVVLSVIGWRRLRAHHRKAAMWLIAGMATFAARWVLGTLSIAYSNLQMIQIRESGGERTEIALQLAMINIFLMLLVIFSLICLGMAAISGRRDPDPAIAPSNISLQRDRDR
jgi:hypothetical protein